MEKYSILMSVYIKDNPFSLRKSLESMLLQTVPSDDFVIIEDGPLTNDLEAILDEYAEKYPKIIHRLANDVNMGLAFSLNRGLSACKNRLVARMDSDDVSSPVRCEEQLKRFANNSDLTVVGTDMVEFENDISNVVSRKRMPSDIESIRKYAKRRSPFNHPSVMYDRNVILGVGGYNVGNHRAEDFELFSKVVFSGYYCENISEDLFFYRTDMSQIKRRFNWASFKSIVSTEYKNFSSGYVTISDFLYVLSAQLFGLVCPSSILKKIMLNHFRE